MRSMTGFGRAEKTIGAYQITLEARSVNHRYLDARFRMPSSLGAMESALNEILRSRCERGSFEISLRQKLNPQTQTLAGNTRFVVDETALQSYLSAVKAAGEKVGAAFSVGLSDLTQAGRVFVAVDGNDESSLSLEAVKAVFQDALSGLVQMREVEGKKLRAILEASLVELESITHHVGALAPEQPKKIQAKLEARLKQWTLGSQLEASRLEWEVALLAEKADITEELDRLGAHLKAFSVTLKADGAVGRRLDFLTQELHRETNTIASKAGTLEITQATVKMKSVIEKLREQVQNVE